MGAKRKLKTAGRKAHAVTERNRKQVLDLISFGMTQPQIGMCLGISEVTLRKYYRTELNMGEVTMLTEVSRTLHNIARNIDDPRAAQAAMFIMKTRAGWRETNRTESAGVLKVEAAPMTVNPRLLSPDERDNLRLIAVKALEAMESEDAEQEDEFGEE